MLSLHYDVYYNKISFMAKQNNKKKVSPMKPTYSEFFYRRLSEGFFIFVLACSVFMLLALASYSTHDATWLHPQAGLHSTINAAGHVGAQIADLLYYVFGYMAYCLPCGLAYVAWLILHDQRSLSGVSGFVMFVRASGLLFCLLGGCGLLSLCFATHGLGAGGRIGDLLAIEFYHALNAFGAALALFAILLVGVTWLTGLSWIKTTEVIGYYTLQMLAKTIPVVGWVWSTLIVKAIQLMSNYWRRKQSVDPLLQRGNVRQPVLKRENNVPLIIPPKQAQPAPIVKEKANPIIVSAPNPAPTMVSAVVANTDKPQQEVKLPEARFQKVVVSQGLPDLQLLDKGEPDKALGGYTHQMLETLSRDLEQHLLDFGIQADVVAVHPGPVITRFELQLAAGIKVSKLSALAKDLARSLSVVSVRVVEVIPGKTVVGLELPNQHRKMVRLSDILTSETYQQSHAPLTLALGVDIAGNPMVVDLAKMPHLLVAGTTGSGKSVGINAMILSLLFKSTPDQVRLIMVDPKMLELSVYDGIPHLLTPVVTDMKEAASALRWCVGEMERRYRLMSALGVRNLAGYNSKLQEMITAGTPVTDPLWKPGQSMDEAAPLLEPLPYIVVVIDELADMMMVVGKKVEQLIARIAQKARAAGIHLILATQRPSVDVLTGLIKSNIPTRMSFQVSSKIDSRTILDQQGAESLLGHGDMLYLAPGSGAPLRVHGAFVDDKEVHRIAEDWRKRGKPEYIEEITQIGGELDGSGSDANANTEDADPLYDQVVEFVIESRKASISGVQRRFKIGYNRAARLVEEMERVGIVGQLENGFRDVLVSTVNEE